MLDAFAEPGQLSSQSSRFPVSAKALGNDRTGDPSAPIQDPDITGSLFYPSSQSSCLQATVKIFMISLYALFLSQATWCQYAVSKHTHIPSVSLLW